LNQTIHDWKGKHDSEVKEKHAHRVNHESILEVTKKQHGDFTG